MKQIKQVLFTGFSVLLIFSAVIYSSCHKDPCRNVICYNGGACSRGNCLCPTGYSGNHCQFTSIEYFNNTYTPVIITIGGSTTTIPAGGSVIYDGTPGTYADGSAYTSGLTGSGSQIGLKLIWNFNTDVFPQIGTDEVDINVSKLYFFLRIKNASPYRIGTEYVNYNQSYESVDNVVIPNDGNYYDVGYYDAFPDTRLHFVSTGGSVFWNDVVSLPNTMNQHYLSVAY